MGSCPSAGWGETRIRALIVSEDEMQVLIIILRARWGTHCVSDGLRVGAEIDVLLGVNRRGMVDTPAH